MLELKEIKDLLVHIKEKVDAHLDEEKHIQPHLIELVDILQKSKGVVTFFKLALYIGAPLAAIIAWSKDHLK
jgi:hypothetical protein